MRSGVAPASSTISISGTEAASKDEPSEASSAQDLRRRIGLHRIEDAAVGQRAGEGSGNCGARRRGRRRGRGPSGRRSSRNARMRSVIIGRSPHAKRCSPGSPAPMLARDGDGLSIPGSPQPAEEPGGSRRTARRRRKNPSCEPSLGAGETRSARPAMRVCASSVSPAFGGPTETKKARHRRCFKPPSETLGDHRHVRIWASPHVCASRPRCKKKCGQASSGKYGLWTGRAEPPAQKERGDRSRPSRSPPDRFS